MQHFGGGKNASKLLNYIVIHEPVGARGLLKDWETYEDRICTPSTSSQCIVSSGHWSFDACHSLVLFHFFWKAYHINPRGVEILKSSRLAYLSLAYQ